MIREKLKKLFGGVDLTWPKLLIFAVAAGVYTAVMAIIPALQYTSFHTIVATLEVWIFFGIFIIMNSKSAKDSALKCFVFFLISQPLIYLLQVPFSWQGWNLFQYYKFWFVLTVLCLPMGYVGYYMKKGNWWGFLILLPMILLTAYSYFGYFSDMQFSFPRYTLIVLFCALAMFVYPLGIFENKKIRLTGVILAAVLTVGCAVLCLADPPVYHTQVLGSSGQIAFDDTWTARLEDSRYGQATIIPMSEGDYLVHTDFRHAGDTRLILESPAGEKAVFDLHIERTTYDLKRVE